MNFQNSGTRSLIWLYTNDAKTEGYRIDIDGVNRYMQYASLPVTASSIIGTFYMSGIRTVEVYAQTLGSTDNLPGNSICWINPSGVSGGIPNLPSQQAYHIMTVYTLSDTYGFQLAFRHDAGAIYLRTKSGGTWSSWRLIG